MDNRLNGNNNCQNARLVEVLNQLYQVVSIDEAVQNDGNCNCCQQQKIKFDNLITISDNLKEQALKYQDELSELNAKLTNAEIKGRHIEEDIEHLKDKISRTVQHLTAQITPIGSYHSFKDENSMDKRMDEQQNQMEENGNFGQSDDEQIVANSSHHRMQINRRFFHYSRPDKKLTSITEGIYLSSEYAARSLDLLHSNGITHIVNLTTDVPCLFANEIVYLKLTAWDSPTENLKQHFDRANEFMRKAIDNGGKVLVHCNMGISRSTTIVLAYLMFYERKTLHNALKIVRDKRPIARPNDGFIDQLRNYELELGLRKAKNHKK